MRVYGGNSEEELDSFVDEPGLIRRFAASLDDQGIIRLPRTGVNLRLRKSGESGGFVLCVEINAIGDPNETYPDPELGQPSLLYTALLYPEGTSRYKILELTAHGGEAIESGTLNYDLDAIDSARELIDLLLAHSTPIQK